MKNVPTILIAVLLLFIFHPCKAQIKKPKTKLTVKRSDSVTVLPSQRSLFIAPKKNLFTTHADAVIGASRVMRNDRGDLGFAATIKGLYSFTGALYVNMGMGVTLLNSRSRDSISNQHKATVASIPIGVGFTIGDDRAQIINSIDFLPIYYIDNPTVKRERKFTYGIGIDLGFHIRIRQRLHLGMMGKLQLFTPYDKDETTSVPRYGFVGAGVVLRYD